jgi:hypothetical protein
MSGLSLADTVTYKSPSYESSPLLRGDASSLEFDSEGLRIRDPLASSRLTALTEQR